MGVKNVSKNKVLAATSRIADSPFRRVLGLMFSKAAKSAMILKFSREAKVHLHTFFVFYPLDIVFADRNMAVVEVKRNMQPFRTYSSRKKAKYVIELPVGVIAKTNTSAGDKLMFFEIVRKKLPNGRTVAVRRV